VAEPFPESDPTTIDPWVSTAGVVAHPDAPAGGGGFGSFRGAALLGSNGEVLDAFPHPQSPAARQLDPAELQDKAEALDATPQKPAPLVSTDAKQKVAGIDVTTKADAYGGKNLKEGDAGTTMQVDPGATPGIETDQPDGVPLDKKKHRVTKLSGPLPVITATIQTTYKNKSVPTGKSAYGRGTTDQDKKDGNTSLAFHESCHRQDGIDYLKAHTLPKFTGAVKMTVEEWEKAVDDYNNAVFKYQDDADAYSEKTTDETGKPKKSDLQSP
jgi:hypothetical protein